MNEYTIILENLFGELPHKITSTGYYPPIDYTVDFIKNISTVYTQIPEYFVLFSPSRLISHGFGTLYTQKAYLQPQTSHIKLQEEVNSNAHKNHMSRLINMWTSRQDEIVLNNFISHYKNKLTTEQAKLILYDVIYQNKEEYKNILQKIGYFTSPPLDEFIKTIKSYGQENLFTYYEL